MLRQQLIQRPCKQKQHTLHNGYLIHGMLSSAKDTTASLVDPTGTAITEDGVCARDTKCRGRYRTSEAYEVCIFGPWFCSCRPDVAFLPCWTSRGSAFLSVSSAIQRSSTYRFSLRVIKIFYHDKAIHGPDQIAGFLIRTVLKQCIIGQPTMVNYIRLHRLLSVMKYKTHDIKDVISTCNDISHPRYD